MSDLNEDDQAQSAQRNIMYIMVIGFHHKKGCQLEFVYPADGRMKKKSLEESTQTSSDSIDLYELPKRWKHLPSLALPDGSHNYEQDYIYFHLEDELGQDTEKPNKTVFGVSCYRQINASELLNKDIDVTRNTLQKSVCILSRSPFYSSLRLKLHSITTAYFEQKDFHKTQILVNAFHSLSKSHTNLINQNKLLNNSSSNSEINEKSKYFIGLSVSDLVIRYQHKILVLFKLLLLQKKCLFQVKPVSNLSNTIMSLVSLIPDLFFQNDSNKSGLHTCAGFYDSIDLVNSELERKNNKTDPGLTNSTKKKSLDNLNRKMNKKKFKSFSNKTKPKQSSQNPEAPSSSFLNTLSTNIFSFNNTEPPKASNSFEIDSDLYKLTNDELSIGNNTKQSKLDFKQNIYTSNRSSSSSLNQDQDSLDMTHNNLDTIKSKVTNVFKLVDWSTQSNTKPSLLKRSESATSRVLHETDNSLKHKETEIQLSELLQHDFSMPLNIFNEFNILHPYLSLYYLDYFTMINKMSTKLYCTTALMMSMMKDNKNEDSTNKSDANQPIETEVTSDAFDPYKKPREPTSIGYTIGATNVLFKQRLYDDLDAFIDETDIDLKSNEQLKKQLQLTTADLRFADYIIKHVSASRSLNEKHNNNNTNQNTPTLLSFKKTSSFNNFESSSMMTNSSGLSSSWEGSDDWIRLNFKWYLYSLMASIVKEDACLKLKTELEGLLIGMNSELNTSSSSSQTSLENEVVDIDEYIDKVSNLGDFEQMDRKSKKNEKNEKKENRKNSVSTASTSSISSSQYFYVMQHTNSFSAYREDYNTNFVSEFKRTDCFAAWSEKNRAKLEKSLLKYDHEIGFGVGLSASQSMDSSNRFQALFTQLQELDHVRLMHPFNGQISVNDIKLRFNFLFTTTESGRKLNKALAEGGKIVNNTGKAVGDAFSQAKSSFSSFLSSWSSSNSTASANGKTATSKTVTKI